MTVSSSSPIREGTTNSRLEIQIIVTIPRWSTIFLFIWFVVQLAVAWVRAKRAETGVGSSLLPHALIAAALSVVFVRDLFEYVPIWIDAPLVILVLIAILIALVLLRVRLKRYLINTWLEQEME